MKRLVLAEPGAVGDGSAPEPPGALRSRGEEDGRGDGLPAPQETFCPRLGMGKSRGPGFTAREEARHRQCLAPSLQTGPPPAWPVQNKPSAWRRPSPSLVSFRAGEADERWRTAGRSTEGSGGAQAEPGPRSHPRPGGCN